jgi:hypothetical protein
LGRVSLALRLAKRFENGGITSLFEAELAILAIQFRRALAFNVVEI